MLVNILIIIFSILLISQTLDYFNSMMREGLENSKGSYQNYPDDPLILGRVNAGNIEVLKEEIVQIPDMKNRINKLEEDVKVLNDQIQGLNQQNVDAVNSFSGSTSSLTGASGFTGDTSAQDEEVTPGEGQTAGEGEGETGEEKKSSSMFGSFGSSSSGTGESGTGESGTGESGTSSGDSSTSSMPSFSSSSFGSSSGTDSGTSSTDATEGGDSSSSLSSYF
jgi:TolA-binding protein